MSCGLTDTRTFKLASNLPSLTHSRYSFPIFNPMNLPSDIARCDGLLPKLTHLPDGTPVLLYSIDCPHRDNCARYCQTHRDDPTGHLSYCTHHHAPITPCPDYISE